MIQTIRSNTQRNTNDIETTEREDQEHEGSREPRDNVWMVAVLPNCCFPFQCHLLKLACVCSSLCVCVCVVCLTVRPRMAPSKSLVMVRCISSGSRQLLVKPASVWSSLQMKVFSSTRATTRQQHKNRQADETNK